MSEPNPYDNPEMFDLVEIHEYVNGVHVEDMGLPKQLLDVYRDMIQQAARDEDGKLWLWLENGIAEDMAEAANVESICD